MVNSCCGFLERHLGGEATNVGGEASLQTVLAKLATVSFTGVVASEKRCHEVVNLHHHGEATVEEEGGVVDEGAAVTPSAASSS